jgi:hypothetical protein
MAATDAPTDAAGVGEARGLKLKLGFWLVVLSFTALCAAGWTWQWAEEGQQLSEERSAAAATQQATTELAATGAADPLAADEVEEAAEAAADPGEISASAFGLNMSLQPSTTVVFLVLAFALVGSATQAVTAFAGFLGKETFERSWTAWYLLRPFSAMLLGLLTYVVFRAGFLSASPSTTEDLNLYGIAAIAGFAGLFSREVVEKLKDVMTIAMGVDAAGVGTAPAIVGPLEPATAVAGTEEVDLSVRGTGFGDGARIVFGDVALETDHPEPGTLKAKVPAAALTTASTVTVTVEAPDGSRSAGVSFTIT